MTDPKETAMELQFDAGVAEALGHGPPDDLAARITLCLRGAGDHAMSATRHHRLAAAALLLLGLGAVAAALIWKEREPDQRAAEPTQQDPQAPQGKLDAATRSRIEALLKSLELPEARAQAIRALAEIGPLAAPLLDTALATERVRGQPELREAFTLARQRLPLGITARVFDLPAEPVTLMADYSDNRVLLVGVGGNTLWEQDEMFGAWDAEFTATGTVLITEFSVSRVREVDRSGKTVWDYDGLKNPYAAHRLPNGNTLIADTFGSRVIEVNPQKQIVWWYKTEGRPFDCERLPDGNTLIADVVHDRALEVSPAGEIVWELEGMNNVHDADRLPNGNTLITLRSKGAVLEVDPAGNVVWELHGLSSPSDADRLPNGNTLVAENTQVREFDAQKQVVWRKEMTWAVAANRY